MMRILDSYTSGTTATAVTTTHTGFGSNRAMRRAAQFKRPPKSARLRANKAAYEARESRRRERAEDDKCHG